MSKRILIIDDEKKMGDILKRALKREGYDVKAVTDPLKGLEEVKLQTYNIILCDLKMPKMGGIEVLEECKKISPNTAFFLMTAYATVENAVESMKKGAYDYLIKPFSLDEMKIMVRRILDTQVLKHQYQASFLRMPQNQHLLQRRPLTRHQG